MSTKATSFNEPYEDRTPAVGDKLSETATQAKEKVSELGRTAAGKIDENRDAAASGLNRAASALHDKADSLPIGEKGVNIAHATADKLSSTAEYVREHDVKQMFGDVETLVKKNPGPALLIAAAFGFLVAQAFSNND